MATAWVSENNAFGFCDRCSFRYPLNELKYEFTNLIRNGLRVCPECFDEDHPQLQVGRYRTDDVQSLRDPRPDNSQAASRRLSAWNPVGQDATSKTRVLVGLVTITIA